MKHSIMIGSFIGVTFASSISFIFRFFTVTYWNLVIILYMYVVVGALTAFFIERKTIKYKSLEESFKNKKKRKSLAV